MDVDGDLRRHEPVPTRLVGEPTTEDGTAFMRDLAARLSNRVQLTTDGLGTTAVRSSQRSSDLFFVYLFVILLGWLGMRIHANLARL